VLVATLSPFISRKSQNSTCSATIARSSTVVAPRGGSHGIATFLASNLLAQFFFFFAPKNHSNILYGVEKRLWESRSTPTLGDILISKFVYFLICTVVNASALYVQ
jgi:hypothetical protein